MKMIKARDLKERIDCYISEINQHDEKIYKKIGRVWACVRPPLRTISCGLTGDSPLLKPEAIYQIIFRKYCFKNPGLNQIEKIDWNHRELFVLSFTAVQPHWIIATVCQKFCQKCEDIK